MPQWWLDEQLARAQARGDALPAWRSAWSTTSRSASIPRALTRGRCATCWRVGCTVGAPPDAFNQVGQDWSQPPWRPDALAEAGYAPFRDMIRTVLRHAGGLRVDHVLGLFRLWWVPEGQPATEGTYVRYDHEALVGILALEAHRAGAVVIGEDLGTVEPWMRDHLRERGILGTSILWFERDGARPAGARSTGASTASATVTTHDLPPTAGYLAGEHLAIRERARPADPVGRGGARRRRRGAGGVHRALRQLRPAERAVQTGEARRTSSSRRCTGSCRGPRRGCSASRCPTLVGDRRAMNQPGTDQEYPNWRVPLTDGIGRPVLLEDLSPRRRWLDALSPRACRDG